MDKLLELNFDFIEIWVQVHGLPLEFWDEENLRKIIVKLSQVSDLDILLLMGNITILFPRIKVSINITKPFLKGESKS